MFNAGKLDDAAPYKGDKGYLPHPKPHAAYAAMVTRMDRTIGRILDLLKSTGIDEETIVAFASDNGPTHDVGGADTAFFKSGGGLRGLKGSVYEGGISVPFLVRWPGRIKPGSVSDFVGYFPDVPSTLLELAGVSDALPSGLDGMSFAPTLLGRADAQKPHDFLYWEFSSYGGQQAVRMGSWKGVRQNLRQGKTAIELYNLDDDPSEARDVAADHPDVVARVREVMERSHGPSALFPLPTIDPK